MSYFKKIVFFTLGFDLLLLLFVALGFKVDDMTLSKGKVDEFNSGWVLTGEDGESVILDKLPYMGESTAEETLEMENTIRMLRLLSTCRKCSLLRARILKLLKGLYS